MALLAAGALALLTGGCAPQTVNPLVKNEATDVPGLTMNLHPAMASDANADTVSATLYFRYMDEPMLASESRNLTVRRDESVEYAIVEALTEGPSAGHSELKRLLPAAATVESVVARDDILFVTFNEGFLMDDVPETWADSEYWLAEAPLLRKLIVQSIVASVTESFPYTGVQILVHRQNEVQTSLRLDNAYFLTGEAGLSDPVARNENLLLSPRNTAEILLTAWQQHDFERLYRYLAEADKPSYATATETLSKAPSLTDYTVSAGTVSDNGQTAALTVDLQTLNQNVSADTQNYPLLFIRENGIWKMTYARLTAMMAR